MMNCSGFTLLELIIVLCLAALSVGLVAVNFTGALATTQIKSEVRKIASTMRYAKIEESQQKLIEYGVIF